MEGALAQLVEQWTENPCVPGSIPGGTTLIESPKRKFWAFLLQSLRRLFPRDTAIKNETAVM